MGTAAIGGIAGGAVAGAILLGIIIWLCCRKHPGSDDIDEKYTRPLTSGEMYFFVKDLETTQEWQDAYIAEAKRMATAQHVDHVSWMRDFSARAVQMRIKQLRDGGARDEALWKAGGIGAIPVFGKIWGFFRDSTKKFNLVAIHALGMGDEATARELGKKAKAAADKSTTLEKLSPAIEFVGKHAFEAWWTHSSLAAQLQQELAGYLAQELGGQVAFDLMSELVHVKLGLGQLIAANRAAWRCDDKMRKALEWLQGAAAQFHWAVFVVNALSEVSRS